MYRWPIRLVPGLDGEGQEATSLVLEIAPRGAAFTLSSLCRLGHPVHLALVDAFLAGGVPMPRGVSLGEDSQAIVAALTGPLVLLYQLAGSGAVQATLADLLLLPPPRDAPGRARFLFLASAARHLWLTCTAERAAETTPEPGRCRVVTTLPASSGSPALGAATAADGPLLLLAHSAGRTRPTTDTGGAPLAAALRSLGWGRAGAAPRVIERAVENLRRVVEAARTTHGTNDALLCSLLEDAIAEAEAYRSVPVRTIQPDQLGPALRTHLAKDRVMASTITRDGLTIDVAASLNAAGGATLALLPRRLTTRDWVFARMAATAWATLESLIGQPLTERRSEAIALRLTGPERSAELLIGWSLVLPRNRQVFAAWLGSDGRLVIRLSGDEPAPAGRLL